MIQILYELGRRAPIELPINPVKTKGHLVILDTTNQRTYREDMDKLKAKEYLWVGNRKGNIPQDFLITNNLTYLLFQSPFNLLRNLEFLDNPEIIKIRKRLEKIIQNYSKRIEGHQGQIIHMLNPFSFLALSEEKERFQQILSKELGEEVSEVNFYNLAKKYPRKRLMKAVVFAFQNAVAGDLPKKEKVYWTLKDEEGLLVKDPGYRYYVVQAFSPPLPENAPEQHCHLCNQLAPVIADTGAFKFFKFFNKDKPGFAPGISASKFSSLFGVCKDCYRKLFAGDRVVYEKFRTRLAGKALFLLPYPVPDHIGIHNLAEVLVARVNAAHTIEEWREFQKRLQEETELREDWEKIRHLLKVDFVFATTSQSAVKIHKVIHEVPPFRLDELDYAREESRKWAEGKFGDFRTNPWDMSLNTQYQMFPTPKNAQVPERFIEYLENLLLSQPIKWESLVSIFVEAARIHYVEGERGYRMRKSSLDFYMVQSLVLRQYLQVLGLLQERPTQEGGIIMERVLSQELRDYLEKSKLSGKRAGLFLLGYVIGKVANVQMQGVSRSESKSPTILNAITFTGMDESKIQRLFNHVFDRMRHYLKGPTYSDAEKIWAVAQEEYQRGTEHLSPHETTYWVLAGYGFARLTRFANTR